MNTFGFKKNPRPCLHFLFAAKQTLETMNESDTHSTNGKTGPGGTRDLYLGSSAEPTDAPSVSVQSLGPQTQRCQDDAEAESLAASLPSWDPGGQRTRCAGPQKSGGEGSRQGLRGWPAGTSGLQVLMWSWRGGHTEPRHHSLWRSEHFTASSGGGVGPRGHGRELRAPEQRPGSLWTCGFLFSLNLTFLIHYGGRRGAGGACTEAFKPKFLPAPSLTKSSRP